MAFTPLKTNYQDDVLNTSVNQVRKYVIVNNADGSISLTDVTTYLQTGTFIGAQDLNLICGNMNTIMGYIETSSGDLAAEFQTYFNEQKTLFETTMNNENADFVSQFDTYLTNFKASCSTQFNTWYDANTADWSQEVADRIDAIIQSLTELVEDNGPFVLNKAYKVANLVTWNIGDGITRGYLVINPVPANMGIYPTNSTYFMMVTREGAAGVGLGLTPRGVWNDQETYVLNDWVIDNFIYWRCLEQNTNSKPSETNAKWHKEWDITAEIPIQFEDYTVTTPIPSLKDAINALVSGATLRTLFGNIKVAFLKVYDNFNDLLGEVKSTLQPIAVITDTESKSYEITEIQGETFVKKTSSTPPVSPDNVATLISTQGFSIVSSNEQTNLLTFDEDYYDTYNVEIAKNNKVIILKGSVPSSSSIHSSQLGNINLNGTYKFGVDVIREGIILGNVVLTLKYITQQHKTMCN